MPTPFDDLDVKEATDLVVAPEGYDLNRVMYDGDMWGKDGCFWIGPRPATGDTGAADTLTKIKKALISKNVIAEVVNRHVSAVLRHSPSWSFAPRRTLAEGEQVSTEEQALIDEADALLTQWLDERGGLAMLQDATAILLLGGRAPLRLYVPAGLVQDGRIPSGDLADSLALIYADPVPAPDVATVVEHAATRAPIGIYTFTEENQARAEVVYREGEDTVIRILGGDETTEPFRFNFGGRLTMYQMNRSAMITPQVRQQQMLINLALTMLGRNVVLGGFLERLLLNAQLPGTFQQQSDGTNRFVPEPLQLGAGMTNVISGFPIHGDPNSPDQITGYTTPSIVYRDPVPPDTFVASKEVAYRGVLEEVHQLHAIISGDAAASGESRKQARADFVSSLADTTTQIERAGRWLLETLLAMASAFSGQPGRFEALRAVVTCEVDAGPILAEDQQEARDNAGAGLLSEETAMSRIGVEDVKAEKAKIAEQRTQRRTDESTNASAILGRAGLLAREVQGNVTGTPAPTTSAQ